jgi:hypothetical protein
MRQLALIALVLLWLAGPALAQGAPETLIVDAPTGVTACEVERSTDNGTTWVVQAPQVAPAGTPRMCSFALTPPTGRTLYRWAYMSGATRTLRTDAGIYLCVGLADCPLAPSNVGVK